MTFSEFLQDFIECVMNTSFENLLIVDLQNPQESAFPFSALLSFVEVSGGHKLEDLLILHVEEFRNHKQKIVRYIEESCSKMFASQLEILNQSQQLSRNVHRRISDLEAALVEKDIALRDREERIAVLESAVNADRMTRHHRHDLLDRQFELNNKRAETKGDRQHLPRPSNVSIPPYGLDGVDEPQDTRPTRGAIQRSLASGSENLTGLEPRSGVQSPNLRHALATNPGEVRFSRTPLETDRTVSGNGGIIDLKTLPSSTSRTSEAYQSPTPFFQSGHSAEQDRQKGKYTSIPRDYPASSARYPSLMNAESSHNELQERLTRFSPAPFSPVPFSPPNLNADSATRNSRVGSIALSQRSSRLSVISMPSPLTSRSWAPGLSIKGPKIDPYDPLSRLAPKDEYTLLKEKEDAELRGAWTTIDSKEHKRSWDRLGKEEINERSRSLSESPGAYRRETVLRVTPTGLSSKRRELSFPRIANPTNERSETSSEDPDIDSRFENPELDIDSEIRNQFRGVQEILHEVVAPQSAFEQRNRTVLSLKNAAPVKVMIGGKIMKAFQQKPDRRGESQDRHGNYIVGQNQGLMKKHLEEDRKRLIQLRDEEMVHATQAKRSWDAMNSRDKEASLEKKGKTQVLMGLLGAGVSQVDCFEYTDIPDIYTRKITAETIATWSARNTPHPISNVSEQNEGFRSSEDEDQSLERFSAPEEARDLAARSDRSDSTIRPLRRSTIPHTSEFVSLTTESDATSLLDERGPTLEPLRDTTVDLVEENNTDHAVKYDIVSRQTTRRGRIVVVRLHEPVHYSTSAMVARMFGGLMQAIQFHPQDRTAIAAFVFPSEADNFIRHIKAVKENDAHGYRQLQIDAEWYGGNELKAIYPIQPLLVAMVIAQSGSRVLNLRGIPTFITKEEFARDLSFKLQKVLVKVAIVSPSKRYVKAQEGNTAILEFASIKDASEAKQLFDEGKIADYGHCGVGWFRDSCDREADRKYFCPCSNCKTSI
ncbi:MAG: hypothetical protein M1827_001859 [Pycnora praestabilis]|nr:MAG: hypothetical protein M1827_001859 [Pycnora praestabilis]